MGMDSPLAASLFLSGSSASALLRACRSLAGILQWTAGLSSTRFRVNVASRLESGGSMRLRRGLCGGSASPGRDSR